ncbi:MAG: hypothetical protein ACD_4C00012G0006, partial [uncultured bacterium (gcode 4)]
FWKQKYWSYEILIIIIKKLNTLIVMNNMINPFYKITGNEEILIKNISNEEYIKLLMITYEKNKNSIISNIIIYGFIRMWLLYWQIFLNETDWDKIMTEISEKYFWISLHEFKNGKLENFLNMTEEFFIKMNWEEILKTISIFWWYKYEFCYFYEKLFFWKYLYNLENNIDDKKFLEIYWAFERTKKESNT